MQTRNYFCIALITLSFTEVHLVYSQNLSLVEKYISIADSLSKRAQYKFSNALIDSSNSYYNKAISIFELNENWKGYVDVVNKKAWNFVMKDDNREVISLLKKAFLVSNNQLDPINLVIASSHNLAGYAYRDIGDFQLSIHHFEKCINIRLKLVGEKSPQVAGAFNDIGTVYEKIGKNDKALIYYDKCLIIAKQLVKDDDPRLGSLYNNMGMVYLNEGDFTRSLKLYEKSLSIILKTYGKDNLKVATSYNNIGIVYRNTKEYEKALEFYQKSLDIRVKILDAKHQDLSQSYNNIGNIYRIRQEGNKAIDFQQKALKVRLAGLPDDHPLIGVSYLNLAEIFSQVELDSAVYYYNMSLGIFLNKYSYGHQYIGKTYMGLGNVSLKKQKLRKALNYFQKAVDSMIVEYSYKEIYKNPLIDRVISKPVLLNALVGKAEVLFEIGS
ncbi:MAG: tetratricopeptide repeat protein [Bacteroidia bacterium]|nr:tetratricopeptide repeat protein [Bacteroidia bacterium]MBL4715107.1 tetratricopeptide repeat protein [Bacteroidia bacterium]